MNRNNGLIGLVDKDMTQKKLAGDVFSAYGGELEQEVLECMGVDELQIIWDRRPNKDGESLSVVVEIDPKDIHDAKYSEDGEHIPHRHGGER